MKKRRDFQRRTAVVFFAAGYLWGALPRAGWARTLECPETGAAMHREEATATSAPEVKVRNGADLRATVRPLTIRALRLAKEQRAIAMQKGIENECTPPQVYVGDIPEPRSGCEHRVITRSSEGNYQWVQVVVICKYDWSCCSPNPAKGAGFSIEGPLAGPSSSSATATGQTKPSKN